MKNRLLFVVVLLAGQVQSATQTWTGASSAYWTNAANWSPSSVPVPNDDILFNSSSAANLATILGTNFTVRGIALADPAGAVSLAGNAFTNRLTLGAGGIDLSAAAQDLAFGMEVVLAATQAWSVATGRTVFANGPISGAFGLTKTGPGLLILNAANSFSGGTVVSNGTMQLRGDQAGNRIPAGSAVRIETNGVVDYYDTNASSAGNPPAYTVNPGGVLLMGQANHVHLGAVNLNGGRVAGQVRGAGAKYNAEDYQMDGTTTVGGSQPSTILLEYGIGLNGTPTFNVADVTGDAAADLTVGGPAAGGILQNKDSGSNGFIKSGAGTMLIDAMTTFNGTMTINAGTVKLGANGTLPHASVVTVGAGSFLDVLDTPAGTFVCTNKTLLGSGTVSGSVELAGGSVIGGGTAGSAGTLTLSGNLTLPGTATNGVDLGGGQNDRISVGGALVLNADTIAVNATAPLTNGTYTIVTYPPALKAGSFSPTVLHNTRKTITVDETPTDHVALVVSGAGALLRWNGTNSTAWDVATSTNWYNTAAAAEDVFLQGDEVLFDDTAGVTTAVVLAATVSPAAVTVDSSANHFTIGGAGKIGGTAALTKSGTSTLTLGGTGNDFTGPVVVSNGILKAGGASALGATNGTTTILGGATLDVNAQNLGQEPVVVAGAGAGGAGALFNSGADQQNALQRVTLSGDTTVGGTGRFDVRGGGGTYLNQNGFTLTKEGANQFSLVGAADTNGGDLVANAGTLGLESGSTITGPGSVYVNPSATLMYWGTPLITRSNVLNGGVVLCGNAARIIAPFTIHTGSTITCNADLTLTNSVAGAAGFTKNGGSLLILSGSNSYAGATTIAAGTVQVGTNGAGGTLGSGNVTNHGALTILRPDLYAYAGTINGSGSLNQNGAGAFDWSGDGALSGGVFGRAGQLVFNGNTFVSSVGTNARSISLQGGATMIVTNNATLDLNGTVVLGTGGNGNSGHIVQYSGSINIKGAEAPNVNYRALQIGEYPQEGSTYTMLGGSLHVTNGVTYLPWNATQGIWTISSATAVVKQIQVSTGVGILNLNSGSLTVGPGGMVFGSGAAVFNMGGGTVGAYAPWSSTLNLTLTGTNGPTTFDTGTNTITLSGLLSGTGGLTKAGSGALWLNRTNETYADATVVMGGTLAGGGTLASAVTMNDGTTLSVGPPAAAAGVWTMPALTLNNGASVLLPFNATSTVLNVTGAGAFTTASTNQISVAGNIATGTFPIIDYAGAIQGAGVSGLALLPVTPRGSASLVDNVAGTTVDLFISGLGEPIRWLGTVNNQWNINTTTNWETTAGATPTTYLQNPNGDLVLFDDAASLFVVNIPSAVSPLVMTVSNEVNDYVISGSAIGGVNGLAKHGAGKLTLGNTNTFSGVVAVHGGTLAIAADGSLGAVPGAATPQIILGHGAGLEALSTMTLSANRRILLGPEGAAGSATVDTGANTLTLPQIIANNAGSTGTLVKTGSGTLNLPVNGNTYSGGTILNDGTINITAGGNNTATALGVGRPVTINTGAVLRLAAGDALGYFAGNPNPMTILGGTMTVVTNVHDSVGNFGFVLNAGTITCEGAGSATGNYIFDGPVTTLSNASPSIISAQKINVRVNPITYNVAAGGGAADLLVTASMYGNGMVKNGAGTMVMSGTNTYGGGTTVNGGVLSVDLIADGTNLSRIGNAGGAGNYLALAGGTLRLTGAGTNTTTRHLWIDQAAGGFDVAQADGTLVLSPAGGNVTRGVTKTGPGALVLNGVIGGTSYVAVAGGTLVLHAANTHTGPTTVTNATLAVNGSALNSAVGIANGATLTGTGSVGAVTCDGAVSPGSSAGILTVAGYVATSNAVLRIELGGATGAGIDYDELVVAGAATLGGALSVALTNGYTPILGDSFVLMTSSGITGGFAATNLPALNAGLAWDLQYVAGLAVTLSVVSAPGGSGYDLYAQQITNAADRGYAADPDGDGYANLLEYVTGGNPTNADQAARMNGARSNGVLSLQFTRSTGSTDATLYVEGGYAATNDASWLNVAINSNGIWTSGTAVETGGPNPVNVTVQDTDPAATNRFLRLRVTRP